MDLEMYDARHASSPKNWATIDQFIMRPDTIHLYFLVKLSTIVMGNADTGLKKK
jgi:hypothetical protein